MKTFGWLSICASFLALIVLVLAIFVFISLGYLGDTHYYKGTIEVSPSTALYLEESLENGIDVIEWSEWGDTAMATYQFYGDSDMGGVNGILEGKRVYYMQIAGVGGLLLVVLGVLYIVASVREEYR